MIKKEVIDKEVDLSDHLVILGSGLNAISAIYGITDNLDDNIKKIYVIDAGLTKDNSLIVAKKDCDIKMPSPKFKIQANHYVYNSFRSMLNITSQGFEAIGSLAKGGLSNIWGATIQPYSNKELSEFPYNYEDVKDIYTRIYQILIGSRRKLLVKKEIKHGQFIISDPLLAINSRGNNSDYCHLKSCGEGCINCNKNIFNSKDAIDNFINLNKIEYLPGLFIKSILMEDGFYFIKCMELSSDKIVLIKASIIYCCLGAISTSKIVLSMSRNTSEAPLLSTPGGSFFLFSFRNFHKKNHSILSSKSFTGSEEAGNYEGNIFPFSKNLICTYFGEFLGGIINFIFRKVLFSRLFIANIYFDSDMSSSIIACKNDRLIINSRTPVILKLFFKKTMGLIRKEFFSEGLLVVPFSEKLLAPGQDIHYGGSIPMKKNPQKSQCNFNGELEGFKDFYIADASSMPFLASKGQSFNSMVNAYYITSKSVKAQTQD
tara:strand:- start:4137 stop:5597 length:1461 start_codon:yes stop_codon:yes gene_type:complete